MESDSKVFRATEDDDEFEEKTLKNQDFINEMKMDGHDGVADILTESLKRLEKFKLNENRLLRRVEEIDVDMEDLNVTLGEANGMLDIANYSLKVTSEENESLRKELDSAHLREQDYQELIDSLRSQTEFLESEMDKVKKEQDDLATELGISGRSKEAFYKEREKLRKENSILKSELGTIQVEREDISNELGDVQSNLVITQQQLEELKLQNSELTRDKGYMSKEAALQRSLVHQLKKNLILLKTHHDSLRIKLDDSMDANNVQKINLFDVQRVNKELRTAINNDQKEMSNLNRKIYDLTQNINYNKKVVGEKEKEMLCVKKKMNEAERKERKMQKAMSTMKSKQLRATRENLYLNEVKRATLTEMRGMKDEKDYISHNNTQLNRDLMLCSAHLLKTTSLAADYLKKYDIESKVRRTIELERDKLKHDLHKHFIANLSLSSQNDRCKLENTQLERKYEEELLYVRHKEHLIADLKKEMEGHKMEIRKRTTLYEDMKAERNVIARSLSEYQEMTDEMKRQNKILMKQLDQLKEQTTMKDNIMMKIERLNKRKVNEGVKLKWQLTKSRNQLKACKDTNINLEKDQVETLRMLDKAKKETSTLSKHISKALNEKSVTLTQLDRKSAELSCLQDSVNYMDITLKKGDRQYNQRLEDIKILRLEVLKIRREKDLVVKALDNSADLRKEVYHLYSDLNKERTKRTALEEEMQTPINFHRWRILQGTDPSLKESIEKVRYLQRELIATRQTLCEKEFQLDEMKAVYEEFRRKVASMPGSSVYEMIAILRNELSQKDKDIKTLSTVVASSDLELNKLRLYDQKSNRELEEYKKKYFDLKLAFDQRKLREGDVSKKPLKCSVSFTPPTKTGRLNHPSENVSSTLVIPIKCRPKI